MNKKFRKPSALFAVIIVVALLAQVGTAPAQGKKLVRIHLTNRAQAEELISYPLDFASSRIQRYADAVVTEEDERFLQQRGFKLETRIENLERAFQAQFAGRPDLGDYHTYQEMYDEMLALANAHPNITRLTSIGRSLEGRDIWAMKLSDNPKQEEASEPDLLYMANMHARELITPEVILYFLNHLVNNYGKDSLVTALVDTREFWLIPTQNPDGHVYVETTDALWRKNRRNNGNGIFGVDLNRNYGYKWGYDNVGSSPFPSSETYRGPGPFSEPESQVIRQFCQTHRFVLALSYHSYGRLWLFPWGYVAQNTPHHDIFVELANNCVAFNGYTPGNPASGTIYLTNGDTDDYFYGEQTEKNLVMSFSPEVGDSFWPPESAIPTLVQENLGANLYLAQVAGLMANNPRGIFPPAIPVLDTLGVDNDGTYNISWKINDDPDNPAVRFQLDELSGYTTITDNAENGAGKWQLGGFAISTARFHDGSRSFYSGQGDNLNQKMTAAFPMIVPVNAQLQFWTWYDIETDWDYAYLEVSNDGGRTFRSIPGNITTNSNPNGTNLGNGITGRSNSWRQARFSLSAFAGQTVFLRFRYVTDQATFQEGFYVDEVSPIPSFTTITTLANQITGTSYAVTGRSSGVYYYRVRAQDAEAQWGGWSALEDITVQRQPDNLGDVNGDDNCNSTDALILLAFDAGLSIPQDFLDRISAGLGDLDSDKVTNSTDALILLSFDAGMTVPFPVCQPASP